MVESSTTASEFNFLLCPITHQLFNDPVLAEDGHTYEREAIIQWIQNNGTSPLTRQLLTIDQLRPNWTIKNIVDELRSKNYYFKLDVHVKKRSRRALFQAHGKTVWEADWIGKDGPPICLMKINGVKALKEASFYEKMTRHPHIVKTYGIVDEPADVTSYSIMLLQEFASEGNLFELLQEQSSLPNPNILCEMFVQISDAMVFLAHNQLVHGDLACRNVLVFRYDPNEAKNSLVKLTDFGLSRGSSMYAPVGATSTTTLTIVPIRYAASEVLSDSNNRNSYTEKSDMYSMGVLMWEGYSKGEMPWSNIETDHEVTEKVIHGEHLKQPTKCNDTMWSIILKCMSQQPNDRPLFKELKRQLLGFMLGSTSAPEKPIILIRVANSEDDEVIEIAAEEENYVSLATLNSQFPGIIGLKYRSAQTNEWHTFDLLNARFQQPQNEPPSTIYIAVYSEDFKDTDIDKYVYQFFNQLGGDNRIEASQQKAEALKDFLKSHPKIWHTAHVPISLGLICNLWNTEHSLATRGTTMTQLYNNIIQYLLRRYLQNQAIDTSCMDNGEIYESCQQELILLQTIAFEGIKANISFLKNDIIQNVLRKIERGPNERAVIAKKLAMVGIIKRLTDSECSRRNQTEKAYYFIDLNLQKHFAAQYLTNSLIHDDNDEMIKFIQTQKYNKQYQSLFPFVSGLASEKTSSSCMQIFWNALCAQPLDLIGMRHMELIICCLDETNDINMIPNNDVLLNKIGYCYKTCLSKEARIAWELIRLLKDNRFVQRPQLINDILCCAIREKHRAAKQIATSLTETAVTPELINTVVVAINGSDNEVQSLAISVLEELVKIKLTPQLLNILLSIVKHEDLKIGNNIGLILQKSVQNQPMPTVIHILVHALKDQDHRVREHIASALGGLTNRVVTAEVITGLLQTLKDQNKKVKITAALALGKLGDKAATPEVITGLLVALKDPDHDVRYNAVSGICGVVAKAPTPEVINELLKTLKDENLSVRENAVETLGKLGDKAATIVVINELLQVLNDPDDGIRFIATSSLNTLIGQKSSPEMIHILMRALKDNNHHVRKSAASALGQLGDGRVTIEVIDGLVLLLKDQAEEVRWSAGTSLTRLITESTILNVMKKLLQILVYEEFRIRAYYLLKALVEEKATSGMISSLLEAAKHKNSNVRSNAFYLLGKLGEKGATIEVITALLLALKNGDEDAALGLRMLIEKSSSPAITNILVHALKDRDHRVREHVASAFEVLNDQAVTIEVITELLQALKDQNQKVRQNVTLALGKLGHKAATTVVITELLVILKNSDHQIRYNAISALCGLASKLAAPEVVNGLLTALKDQNKNVRRRVLWAFKQLGDKVVSPEVIDGLLLALNDEDSDVRFEAASAIERLRAKTATTKMINGLLQVLKNHNYSEKWRTAYALDALVKTNPTSEVIDMLMRSVRDHVGSYYAIRALAESNLKEKTPEVINCLLLAVNNPDDDLPGRAISILRNLKLYSAVLSKINTDQLSGLAKYEYVFYSTDLSELIGTYLETQNGIWLSIIFNKALTMKFGVTLVEEHILIFGNEDVPSENKIPIQKTLTVSKALIQSFGEQAAKYGLQWN